MFFFFNFGLGFQFRNLPPGSTAASVAYCTIPRFFKRSYFGRQVPLASTNCGSPLAAKGGTMGEKWWPNGAWDMHPGFFYMPQICERKACWGFLSPFKNPTASAGFEPANLGIRAQHATSAPPKTPNLCITQITITRHHYRTLTRAARLQTIPIGLQILLNLILPQTATLTRTVRTASCYCHFDTTPLLCTAKHALVQAGTAADRSADGLQESE